MHTIAFNLCLLVPFSLAACTGNVTPSDTSRSTSVPTGGSEGPDCTTAPPDAPPSSADRPEAVAVDASDNIFVVGAPEGKSVFYVRKLDPSGKELWKRTYGADAFANALAYPPLSAAVDATGRLVVSGVFSGAGDFDGITLTPVGRVDAFAVLLDTDGDIIWRRTFGSPDQVSQQPGPWCARTGFMTRASDVAFDAAGNVLLAGDFGGHVNFGSGALDAANGEDFVVALGGADGAPIWSHQISDSVHPFVSADPSGAVVVGSTWQPPGKSSGVLPSGVLVTKFDATGARLFQALFPGGILAEPSSLGVDGSGNILMVGSFDETGPDFGAGEVQGNGSSNEFVVSLTPFGVVRWSGVLEGADYLADARLAVDAGGQVVVATECEGAMSYRGVSVASKAGRDVCLMRLDANGAPLATGLFSTELRDTLSGVALSQAGDAVLVGVSSDFGVEKPMQQGYVTTISR